MSYRVLVTLILALAAASSGNAQEPPARVRGVIQSLEGQTLVVATPSDGVMRLDGKPDQQRQVLTGAEPHRLVGSDEQRCPQRAEAERRRRCGHGTALKTSISRAGQQQVNTMMC